MEALVPAGLEIGRIDSALAAAKAGSAAGCRLGAEDACARLDFLWEKCKSAGLSANYPPESCRSRGGLVYNDLDNGVALLGERLLI